jgi:hypothetical protein
MYRGSRNNLKYTQGGRPVIFGTREVWALPDEGTAMVTDRSVTGEQRRELVRGKWSDYLRAALRLR